jgi:hypothetical protein
MNEPWPIVLLAAFGDILLMSVIAYTLGAAYEREE